MRIILQVGFDMLLNLIILLVLVSGVFTGYRRGLVQQVIRLVGLFVSYYVAVTYCKSFAPVLKPLIPFPESLTHNDLSFLTGSLAVQTVYYRVIAFILLFLAAKILLHVVGTMLGFVTALPIIRPVNHLSGAALGFVEVYLIVFLLLIAGSLAPVPNLQTAIHGSTLAQSMIGHTPVVSNMVKSFSAALIRW